MLEAYDKETARIKERAEAEKRRIQDQVIRTADHLAEISIETNAAFQQLRSQSEEISSFAKAGAELSQLAGNSAHEGKQYLYSQLQSMYSIKELTSHITADVNGLLAILEEMKGIVSLVTSIADQTNLLSLNAAIEAARAGEFGNGFSVVAGEVRKLSEETKQSVSSVSDLINSINAQVDKLTDSLSTINREAESGNETMGQTQKQFEEIISTVDRTKNHNSGIEEEIQAFVSVVHELGLAFEEVAASADQLQVSVHP
ncbi:methyl-accepting chemotaxis protein [Bacillus sp. 1P06AnD]|uniref:methyl-accepting chemotaxis protein n=1 Tax=Bacillus sp. 1P06AnD TaxID=3132208 RepID=UPI0039A08AA4